MRLLGIAASPPDSGALLDEISDFLSSKGSLAVISPLPVVDVTKQNFSAYQLDEKGNWSASGSNMTLTTLFDILATEHDYALVGGFCESLCTGKLCVPPCGRWVVLACEALGATLSMSLS